VNRISFRVLFLCIFLPPIIYIFSIQILDEYLQKNRAKDLQNIIIQDYEALYNGRHGIKEEISTNIERYFQEDMLRTLGVITKILITTRKGQLLYPSYYYDEGDIDFDKNGEADSDTSESFNYVKTAEKNFQILDDGIILSVDVKIRHNSWLANSIPILCLFFSILILYWYYKNSIRDWMVQRENEQKRIDLLSGKVAESQKSLEKLSKKELDYISNIEKLKRDKEDLKSDMVLLKDQVEIQKKKSLEIDEILDEMERLEEQASRNMALKEEKEREIKELHEEISQLKRMGKQTAKKRRKDITSVEKRFGTIYKNMIFHKKAIDGYLALPQEFQLKAEEIIHRLNQDDSLVPIKRKFFSKKGKSNVFELIFSYSGRIYFKKRDDKRIEIVAIGTKNTQEQDMAFIETISCS
jgi:hypothetical protein